MLIASLLAKNFFRVVLDITMAISRIKNIQAYRYLKALGNPKVEFNSTKELYSYARKKIVGVARDVGLEYLIVADTKKNKILAEALGDSENVIIDNRVFLGKDKRNITVMHGHARKGYPLSATDCLHLCKLGYDKIIAFDTKGKFSLLQTLPNSNLDSSKNFLRMVEFLKKSLNSQNMFKKFFIDLFSVRTKQYDKLLKKFMTQKNVNFRYVSTMHK